MANKRMLHKNICTSDKIDQLTWFQEVLYYRLLVSTDDYGMFYSNPAVVKDMVFPIAKKKCNRGFQPTLELLKEGLNRLKEVGLIDFKVINKRHALIFKRWSDFQFLRPDRKKHSYFGMTDGMTNGKPPDIPEAKGLGLSVKGEGLRMADRMADNAPPALPLSFDFLFKTLKAQNRDFFRAYPKQLEKFSFAISNALINGWPAADVEKEIYKVAGKLNTIKPWEWLKEAKNGRSRSTLEKDKAELARIMAGG